MKKKILTLCLILTPQILFAQQLRYSEVCSSSEPLVTLSFVGDILVHKILYQSVVNSSQKFSSIWEKTDGLIRKADLSIANLEGPAALGIDKNGRDRGDVGFIYDDDVYSGTNFRFNYHPRILNNLQTSGYDLISFSNNHTLDRGSIGVDRTLEAAKKINLPMVGARHSQERNAGFHSIHTVKGLRLAFLACTEMTNGRADSKEQLLLCYKQGDQVVKIIRELAKRNDIDGVIVMPHWGVEYQHQPSSQQKSYARKFLEAGAFAIVGSHPHVLQPWEKYITSDGRETVIMYSLGNFVAGQKDVSRKTGVVTYLGLGKGTGGKARIVGVGYTPTYREGAVVSPVGSKDSSAVLKHAAQFFGTSQRIEPQGLLRPTLCSKVQ